MGEEQGLGTHPLIGAIGAVFISIADPILANAATIGADEVPRLALVHLAAVPLVGSIAAVVVAVAFELIMDAAAVSAGVLVRATSPFCTNPEE